MCLDKNHKTGLYLPQNKSFSSLVTSLMDNNHSFLNDYTYLLDVYHAPGAVFGVGDMTVWDLVELNIY